MTLAAESGPATLSFALEDGGERGKLVQIKERLKDGRYHIQEVLAYGGMGVVFVARDTRIFGNEVLIKGIKYLASEFAMDSQKALYNIYQLRQMFRRERKILAELRNRGINNVPHLNDFFYDENIDFATRTYKFGKLKPVEHHRFLKLDIEVYREPYLVMERIHGVPLVAKRDLPRPVLLRIVRDVLVALARMHERRVREDGSTLELVYLDLKPHNVLVDPCHRVTLIDFGGAMPVVNGKRRKEQRGALTHGYAAPELATLFTPADRVDGRADLYSAGAILWSCLTGKDPISLAHPINDPFPVLSPDELPSDLPGEIRDLVARALQRDPGRRWASAGEMIAVLDRHVEE
jgi:serine/threonine protein kinase